MNEHLPKRPIWDCDTCGQTWPCANANTALLHEYLGNFTSLLTYMALQKWDAFDDFATSSEVPADLDERFCGWVR
jgi:hypothetical protein